MYLKDAYEMSLLFDREIIKNTNDLLRRCNVTIGNQPNAFTTLSFT